MPWKRISVPPRREISAFLRRNRKKCRFLVDESLGIAVADLLRRSGWNTKFAPDVGLGGKSDEDVLAFAHRDDRLLLTHDKHFMDDRRFPPHRNPGLVVLPGAEGNERALFKALGQTISFMGMLRELYRQCKVFITEDGVFTIRTRRFETGAVENTRYRFGRSGDVEKWDGTQN